MNKKFIMILFLLVSLVIPKDEMVEAGRYQLAVSVYESKKGVTYIVETVLDTQTGKVVKRKKIKASSYKLPYKDHRGKLIKED